MQSKFSKKLGIFIVAILTISTIAVAIPFASATITNRPTVYRADGTTDAPVTIEAGTSASIDTNGMTITGAQIWLWLSTNGGSDINVGLGDRPFAGPFLLSELIDTVTPHPYTFDPDDIAALCDLLSIDSPFAGEGRTYSYTLQNGFINGTVPLKVQGEDVDYWIKVVDVVPADSIPGSEIGVSTNRVHFTAGFDATPLMGAPETEVHVSGYALNADSNCSITTENGDFTFVLTSIYPTTNDEGGWWWTGWETAFNIEDLENKVAFGDAPPMSQMINITVWELNTGSPVLYESWDFEQYYREVYLPKGTFRGDGGDYSLSLTLYTGDEYVIDMEYFPAFGTASIYLGDATIAMDVPLNGTGGFSSPWTVPALTTGNYVFSIIDHNDVAYNITVHVVMVPYIQVTPDMGYVGDSFTVTGVNYLDYIGEYITIYFENNDDSPYYTLLLNFTCPSSTWTSPVLTVPNSMGGENLVEVRNIDGTNMSADTTYTVLAKLMVDPSEISNDCSLVSVIGTGLEVWDDYTEYRKTYAIAVDNQFLGVSGSMYRANGQVAATSTGDIVFEIVANGFRPGTHVVAIYGDSRGSYVAGDIDSYSPAAYTCFTVTTEGDPIVAHFEEVVAHLEALNMTMTELHATIMTLDGTIATLSTTVGAMQVDLAEVHAAITSVSGNVATIRTDVGTIKSSMTTLSASISSVSSGIATIQTSLGTVETSLSSLDAVIGSMYGDLLTLDTAIGSVETSIDALEATVSGLGSDMTAVAGDVVSIDTVLGSVAGTVTSMEGTLATIDTDLGTVQVDLASAKADIADVASNVDENLPVDMLPVWIAVVLALIAAIGSIAGVFIIQRKIA